MLCSPSGSEPFKGAGKRAMASSRWVLSKLCSLSGFTAPEGLTMNSGTCLDVKFCALYLHASGKGRGGVQEGIKGLITLNSVISFKNVYGYALVQRELYLWCPCYLFPYSIPVVCVRTWIPRTSKSLLTHIFFLERSRSFKRRMITCMWKVSFICLYVDNLSEMD